MDMEVIVGFYVFAKPIRNIPIDFLNTVGAISEMDMEVIVGFYGFAK
jgi:hypothetical protein